MNAFIALDATAVIISYCFDLLTLCNYYLLFHENRLLLYLNDSSSHIYSSSHNYSVNNTNFIPTHIHYILFHSYSNIARGISRKNSDFETAKR